ncbi:MAG: YfcE family phosphodiesterase [Anaerolineae bacterium]|nr:YfcE family phosphodiesterase [Anaerolineae bacterium]
MRIALVSDTHNDQNKIKQALARLQQEQITTVLHAGDVTSARTLRLFKAFDVWVARGNMDHDPALDATVHELFGPQRLAAIHKLTLDGHTLALVHNGESGAGRELIQSRDYDYVIHGHSHRPRDQAFVGTRVINPGALGNPRWRQPTVAILDLATGDLSWVKL